MVTKKRLDRTISAKVTINSHFNTSKSNGISYVEIKNAQVKIEQLDSSVNFDENITVGQSGFTESSGIKQQTRDNYYYVGEVTKTVCPYSDWIPVAYTQYFKCGVSVHMELHRGSSAWSDDFSCNFPG